VLAWLRAYAAATATTATWESIRSAATGGTTNKPSKHTTQAYTELLKELRILDPLEAWVPSHNHLARVGAAPKHHLADPALAIRLLSRTRNHLLTGQNGPIPVPDDGALLGNLFESLVALSLRTYAQTHGADIYHLRVDGGWHEIDFIIEYEGKVLAVEVKLADAIDSHDAKHLKWLADVLGDDLLGSVIISTGPEAYRRKDGIAVIPFALLGP
jgi:predicted AAA+ superfamily ATPase